MAETKRTKKAAGTAAPRQIKGTVGVMVGKYTGYNPGKPDATPIQNFSFGAAKDGVPVLDSYYAREGYLCIGMAEITITLFPDRQVAENQITALRTERKAVQAKATARCAQIDREIQNLLALPA